MKAETQSESYWTRLIHAVLGRPRAALAHPESAVRPTAEDSRIRSLQMDIQDRDRRIEQMRSEYAALQAGRDRAAAEAGAGQVEHLFKKLSGTLSNLAALTAMHDAGQSVSAADFAALARSLEKELGKAGLERIGTPGEAAAFNVAHHQRMSGGMVRDGSPVTVRVPGYRMGQQILLKAMVTSPEDRHA